MQRLRRIRVPCLIRPAMPAIGTNTYAEFDAVLTKLDENPMDALGVVLGYWNMLVAERDAGRVRLAPAELSAKPVGSISWHSQRSRGARQAPARERRPSRPTRSGPTARARGRRPMTVPRSHGR
jgi:hypothetical protein